MIAIFENWREKREKIGKWLMFISILLLSILQIFTLCEIFYNTRNDYQANIYTVLLSQTNHLNLTKSLTAPLDFLSYNYSNNSLFIKKKSQSIDTIIYLPQHTDTERLLCQGNYDIRDMNVWSLDSLASLLKESFRYQNFIPPFTLTLTDAEGKILDQYQNTGPSLSLWAVHQEILLGFLEHHLLTADFIYPLSYFWYQVWDKVITTLGLFFLLIVSTSTLFVQLRNEKNTGEYRKKFTHTLVHNLRSPIIFLKQQLESIGTLELSAEERQQAFNKCEEKAANVLKDIEHLLSVSVNAYGLVAHYEKFNITAMIRELAKVYTQNQPEKKVTITLEQQAELWILADPTLLEGALGNLIGNSIKYSGNDTQIYIRCFQEKTKTIITITDNGFGIPLEEQQQIFRENYRGRRYMTDRQHKGFGLGLYYVQAVALAHHGHISVKSDGMHGTEFTITIPQKR
mgnify:CR=1 FL=1